MAEEISKLREFCKEQAKAVLLEKSGKKDIASVIKNVDTLKATYQETRPDGRQVTNLEAAVKWQLLRYLEPEAKVVPKSEIVSMEVFGEKVTFVKGTCYIYLPGDEPVVGVPGCGASAYSECLLDPRHCNEATELSVSERVANAFAMAKGKAFTEAVAKLGIGIDGPLFGKDNRELEENLAREDLKIEAEKANEHVKPSNRPEGGIPLELGRVKLASEIEEDAKAQEAQTQEAPAPAAPQQTKTNTVQQGSAITKKMAKAKQAEAPTTTEAPAPAEAPAAAETPAPQQVPAAPSMTLEEARNVTLTLFAGKGKKVGELVSAQLRWYEANLEKTSVNGAALTEKEKEAIQVVFASL